MRNAPREKISNKAFLDNLVKEKINTLIKVKINTLNYTLTGQVWGDTYSLDCPDGGSVTYVIVGIVWELNCEGAYNNIPWSYSVAYCTDIESSPVGGVGCY